MSGSGPFYRAAGMGYLRYSNICADLMRTVMKEPYKAKAMQRQAISFKWSTFANGKQSSPGRLLTSSFWRLLRGLCIAGRACRWVAALARACPMLGFNPLF